MKSLSVSELLKGEQLLQEITIKGWVRTFRANRFVALNDGSTIHNIQCVVDFENTDEDVFINYCDFSNIWDWTKIKKHIKNNKPDGLLPAYKGVHLHTIYRNNYAFIKEQDLKLLSIKEKEPFTDDPMNEFASTGGYYFSTGKVAKKYINQLSYIKSGIIERIDEMISS